MVSRKSLLIPINICWSWWRTRVIYQIRINNTGIKKLYELYRSPIISRKIKIKRIKKDIRILKNKISNE